MEITIAKTYKNELQKRISELLKEFENATKLEIKNVDLVRQSQYDLLGNETEFNYAINVEVNL